MTPEKDRGKAEIGRQMWLTEVHPGKVSGFFKQEPPGPIDRDYALSPERGIDDWHHKSKGPKIREGDFKKWWSEQLRIWGYTSANRQKRIEELMDQGIQKLKEEGVWSLILEGEMTFQEREIVLKILRAPKPIKDLESSEGFTIYPEQESLWKDLHGESDI